jgi:PAS domain S-box-containing protein
MTSRIGCRVLRSELRNAHNETVTDSAGSQRVEHGEGEKADHMLDNDLREARRTIAELKAALVEKERTRAAVEQSSTGFKQRMIDLAMNLRDIRERFDTDVQLGQVNSVSADWPVGSEAGPILARNGWERAFDSLSDLIMILDAEDRIVRVNRAMASRLGVAPVELVGRSCREVIDGEGELPSYWPHVDPVATREEVSVELRSERLRGAFNVRIVPILDGIGRYAGSVHMARDLTGVGLRPSDTGPVPRTP